MSENMLMNALQEASKSKELNNLELKASALYYEIVESEVIPELEKQDILENLIEIMSKLNKIS